MAARTIISTSIVSYWQSLRIALYYSYRICWRRKCKKEGWASGRLSPMLENVRAFPAKAYANPNVSLTTQLIIWSTKRHYNASKNSCTEYSSHNLPTYYASNAPYYPFSCSPGLVCCSDSFHWRNLVAWTCCSWCLLINYASSNKPTVS